MKNIYKGMVALLIILVLSSGASAYKFTIDGDLSDWGITPAEIENGLKCDPTSYTCGDYWVPSYPEMASPRWVVEDDVDPQYASTNPESYDFGPHYAGYGASYWKYDEPKVNGVIQPSPYNRYVGKFFGDDFDVEAIYVDEDADYLYVAAVVSVPPEGYTGLGYPRGAAGDLALDISTAIPGGYGYDYGVRLGTWDPDSGAAQFEIYRTDEDEDWYEATDFGPNSPAVINTAHAAKVGDAIGAYVNASELWDIWEYVTDPKDDTKKKPVYIIELAIPKNTIGLTSGTMILNTYFKVHLAEAGCGNDSGDVSVPEFLSLLLPAGLIVASIFYFRKRRENT